MDKYFVISMFISKDTNVLLSNPQDWKDFFNILQQQTKNYLTISYRFKKIIKFFLLAEIDNSYDIKLFNKIFKYLENLNQETKCILQKILISCKEEKDIVQEKHTKSLINKLSKISTSIESSMFLSEEILEASFQIFSQNALQEVYKAKKSHMDSLLYIHKKIIGNLYDFKICVQDIIISTSEANIQDVKEKKFSVFAIQDKIFDIPLISPLPSSISEKIDLSEEELI
ncbi:MAG: hypothetical protein ISN64_03915 [Rickettsia sp.]|nr:hypothetical protein [Rickettsia sp.]